ncbi:prepilin-type N-terminal cleavage/methylation domain-containing protein [Pseudomaricurvus alkylphenolicus]|uniref:type IV pilin protein n=1 Tax=Pseudomaricurvus alkylphenolicus TaxID=1306991 RepID=UPI00141E7BBD|nr:type IV pilin protein [Pseudomaricurvus alkylphenolicus]NIB40248.1 prepilin-type N-terminal cleavage/methylation domain-containing protein [Pseudomaricurvus alkylphenolicus]
MGVKQSKNRERIGGFTLIEVLITLAIVAILAAIALPSYQGTLQKNRRNDAKAALMGLSQAMERFFTQNNTYVGAATGTLPQPPDIFPTQSPIDSDPKFYNLRITAAGGNTYTLQAIPISGTDQADNGRLQLNHLGQRVWDRDNDDNLTEATDLCWDDQC